MAAISGLGCWWVPNGLLGQEAASRLGPLRPVSCPASRYRQLQICDSRDLTLASTMIKSLLANLHALSRGIWRGVELSSTTDVSNLGQTCAVSASRRSSADFC